MGMLVLIFCVNALMCIVMASSDADNIRIGLGVSHKMNSVLHVLMALAIGLSTHWIAGIASLVQARVVFDLALNYFRFGWTGVFYVSPTPESVIDKLEKAIFRGNGWLPKLFYTATFAGLLFLLKSH